MLLCRPPSDLLVRVGGHERIESAKGVAGHQAGKREDTGPSSSAAADLADDDVLCSKLLK